MEKIILGQELYPENKRFNINCDLCILDKAITQVLLNNEKTNLCEKCYNQLKRLSN